MKQCIKILVMDVDGTLTDGKIHLGADGEAYKSFDVKDGYGIREILPVHGIIPAIITGRVSLIMKRRAEELGIVHLYQGVRDKAMCVQNIASNMKIALNEVAGIGDDLNDLSMMQLCGLKGCPSDAVSEVKMVCDYICQAPGGCGAVREFIEWLIGST